MSSSAEKIGCEDNLSLQYSKLTAKMVEREEEMQRQLGIESNPVHQNSSYVDPVVIFVVTAVSVSFRL